MHIFNIDKYRFWELDIQSITDISLAQDTDPFWRYIMQIWIDFKKLYSDTDPRSYPLWGAFLDKNTNLLKLRGTFERCNIHYINDLLSERGEIYGYEEICTLLNKQLNFVNYYSLKRSIPKRKWRSGLKDKLHKNEIEQQTLTNLLKLQKTRRGVYQTFLEKLQVTRRNKQKWALVLGEDFNEGIWKHFYSINFQSTIDSKLRSFQYKLLHRAIPTNKYLFQCKIKYSDLCYFCHETTESLEHLFGFAQRLKSFGMRLNVCFIIVSFLKIS